MAAGGKNAWQRFRGHAGWLGVLAIVLWVDAALTLLIYGGFFSALLRALAGVMAWSPTFRASRTKGQPTLPNGGRLALGLIFYSASLVVHPVLKNAGSLPSVQQTAVSQPKKDEAEPILNPGPSPEDMRKAEAKNRVKIEGLLADVKTLSKSDPEGELLFWNEITALAPNNRDYAASRDKVQSQVNDLAYYREHPEQGAEVVKIKPRKEGFGSVLVTDITIRNRSLSNLKDFEITCTSSGNSGTAINKNTRTIYEMIEARSTRTLLRINMGFIDGQTTRTNCVVDGASIA